MFHCIRRLWLRIFIKVVFYLWPPKIYWYRVLCNEIHAHAQFITQIAFTKRSKNHIVNSLILELNRDSIMISFLYNWMYIIISISFELIFKVIVYFFTLRYYFWKFSELQTFPIQYKENIHYFMKKNKHFLGKFTYICINKMNVKQNSMREWKNILEDLFLYFYTL